MFSLLALSLVVSGNTLAASATSSMNVTATLVQECKIVSLTNLSFGQYLPATTHRIQNLDASNLLEVSCVAGSTGVRIAFDQGQNPDAGSTCTAPKRRMSNGDGGYLSYAIYSNTGRTTALGCAAGTNTLSMGAPASTAAVPFTQYGRIPLGQDVKIATYTDTVGVTVTF